MGNLRYDLAQILGMENHAVTDNMVKVLKFMIVEPTRPFTRQEIADWTSIPRTTVYNQLENLKYVGVVSREKEPRGGRPGVCKALWQIEKDHEHIIEIRKLLKIND